MAYTNDSPAAISLTAVDFTNTDPSAVTITSAKRNYVFGPDGTLPSAVWENSGSNNVFNFENDWPITFRQVGSVAGAPLVVVLVSIDGDEEVPAADWPTRIFPTGSNLSIRIKNTLSYLGSNVGDIVQAAHTPEANSV